MSNSIDEINKQVQEAINKWHDDPFEVSEELKNELFDKLKNAVRKGVVFELENTDNIEPELKSYLGGKPLMFKGEEWPLDKRTGKPLFFIGQIIKDDVTVAYMGKLSLIRLFINQENRGDIEGMEDTNLCSDETHVVLMSEVLGDIDNNYVLPSGGVVSDKKQILTPKEKLTISIQGSSENIDRWIYQNITLDYGPFNIAAVSKPDELINEFKQMNPKIDFIDFQTTLGTDPFWQQMPIRFNTAINGEKVDLPFFAQIHPDECNAGMKGDSGSFYLFINKDHPEYEFMVGFQCG